MLKAGLVLLGCLAIAYASSDGCTSILVGRKASTDGTAMITYSNDCTNCDVRTSAVPSKFHKKSDKRPVYNCKQDYPRYVGYDRGTTYLPENLELDHLIDTRNCTREQVDMASAPFKPVGYVDQVEYTASYIDANYGHANEYGLMIGESTCAGNLVAFPPPYGDAMFDVAALSRLALERCRTARCAIKLMGAYAEQHGFYGVSDPMPAPGEGMYGSAGEALTLVDNDGETWIFHILPDDTGKSAVWAAQRVPDDHFAVVANYFIIDQVDESKEDYFMASKNMREVAKRAGLWSKEDQEKGFFSFKKAFAATAGPLDHPGWATRRTWQLFRLAAPTLKLEPDRQEPYPFSIVPDHKISLEELFQMSRDNFDGSQFDLHYGPAAGPWGNPNRYDANGLPWTRTGYFERGVSLHRTVYSLVMVSRPWFPSILSGIVWWSQHAPHASVYTPFYAAINEVPTSYRTGSIYELSRESSWWSSAAVANYIEKMFNIMMPSVKEERLSIETEAKAKVQALDKKVMKELEGNEKEVDTQMDSDLRLKIKDMLTEFSCKFGEKVTARWWGLLDFLMTKYRDGFVLLEHYAPAKLWPVFYPGWWLGQVGFYNKGPFPPFMITHNNTPVAPHPDRTPPPPGPSNALHPDAVRARETMTNYGQYAPASFSLSTKPGSEVPVPEPTMTRQPLATPVQGYTTTTLVAVCVVASFLAFVAGRFSARPSIKGEYEPVHENDPYHA